ncbi:MAG: lipopolysaccharide biosynthesis protein [Oscillospiraceae bacterium]|jgi:O-antigen/teichoic acid export membrane protein|nr:lipopolysaccharide biosynthesis protein [Oscillospiraceae bacterium]
MKNIKNINLKDPDVQNNIWTFLSSAVSAGYTFVIVMITTRWVGLRESGAISFALSIAMLFSGFIIYGIRPYQSTDIKQENSFLVYFGMRVITTILTCIAFIVFLLIGRLIFNFDDFRMITSLLMFFIFLVSSFADVFMGELQRKGLMRIAGRMIASVFSLAIIVYLIVLLITDGSIVLSLIFSCVVVFFTFIAWIWKYQSYFDQIRVKFDIPEIKALIWKVTPLFLSGTAFVYLYSMQRYYLGFLNQDDYVAIVTFLIMPATALQLLIGTVFGGAEMTRTAKIYANGQIKELKKRINLQLLYALGIAILFILCSLAFGLPLLSWIFDEDLSAYKFEFLIVSIGGSFLCFQTALGTIIVIMRAQKMYLYCLLGVAFIVAPIMWFVIRSYSILGAAYSFIAFLLPLSIVLYILYRIELRKYYKTNR